MKTLKLKLPSSLLFSLILLTPLIAFSDVVQAETFNSPTSVRAEIENSNKSIDFSPNLGQKLQNEFSIARKKGPQFKLFDNGPTFAEYRQKLKLHDSQPENISALQTFESLRG
ncbi:hypothetical protein [Chamaesiphon sp. VAR_48_metabat_135_sub]|uniref:hypothetical protein n=1 Tax=Chamaesiphon sp. VAR_48_metabat_135_sub TaxID=2964699 RepID=UPI00286BA6F8|nr:hypothetical protein [Chamaesiphon sp. VAR_48_metabat_135_sub]